MQWSLVCKLYSIVSNQTALLLLNLKRSIGKKIRYYNLKSSFFLMHSFKVNNFHDILYLFLF